MQLLPDSSRRLGWPGLLDANNFDQVDDAAYIIFVVLFTRQAIYLNSDRRVRFLLLKAPTGQLRSRYMPIGAEIIGRMFLSASDRLNRYSEETQSSCQVADGQTGHPHEDKGNVSTTTAGLRSTYRSAEHAAASGVVRRAPDESLMTWVDGKQMSEAPVEVLSAACLFDLCFIG